MNTTAGFYKPRKFTDEELCAALMVLGNIFVDDYGDLSATGSFVNASSIFIAQQYANEVLGYDESVWLKDGFITQLYKYQRGETEWGWRISNHE